MDNKRRNYYFLGLFENVRLFIENDGSFCYEEVLEKRKVVVKDKVMKLYKRDENGEDHVEISEKIIKKKIVKQLSDDGSRWEGDWYNGKPFGFGSYYDGEGNRMYRGFVFEGKKVGFGVEYFADTHTVDYCGNFMNDKRHG